MSDQPISEPNPATPPGPQRIAIDLSRDVPVVYSNVAMISHTPVEVVLDFAQILPRSPRGTVEARIIMTPMHAKMLQLALAQNIQNYERQFGEIRLPTQASPLVDSFFRFTTPGSEGGKGE